MRANELRDELQRRFKLILQPKGFKGSKEFYIKNEKNEYRFRYGFASYGEVFTAGVSLITLDYRVSRILDQIKDVQLNKVIVAYNYSHFLNMNSFAFEISSYEDIDKWVCMIQEFMDLTGFKIFETFNSYESLDKLYNSDSVNEFNIQITTIERAYKGILLAKLVDNSNYQDLIIHYRNMISHIIELETKKFEKVVEFLALHSKEELLKM